MPNAVYLVIDLKSFYASVECVERGLNPMTTHLVVADPERGDKTICLAITPAMKALGIPNRCRVFQIPKDVAYIMAPPRMQRYIDYAADIYSIYLSYVSKDDIHVYSVDEAFLDVTKYLKLYGLTARQLGQKIMDTILEKTGVRATCGIGTNLYLAKIALDITAKHATDFMGYLDEEIYKATLWNHTPLTDFWRIGRGTAKTLKRFGIHTMAQLAQTDEYFLYKQFGVDAELLIDHAWGRETVTMADIKKYKAKTNCISSGQVLMRDYDFEEGKLVIKEMMDLLCGELVGKKLVAQSITIQVGYTNQMDMDFTVGTTSLSMATNADQIMIPAVTALYERVVNPVIPVRRIYITCNRVYPEQEDYRQLDLFTDVEKLNKNKKIQTAVLDIKKKYGKNSILKGMDLLKAATTRERNCQIGGHKSGQ